MPNLATPIQAVLFDYGLVLTGPPDPTAWAAMHQLLRVDEPAFHTAYWAPRHDYDRGALTGHAYWHTVAVHLGHVALTADQLQALLAADIALWTQPNTPMIRWAAELQAAGVPTGILSNLGDVMEAGVLAHCRWLLDFRHHTFSHRLGIAKPDPAIYHHAAQGLGFPPAAILFIDDRDDNIQAARSTGMIGIQYTSHENFLRAMHAAQLTYLLNPAPNV